MKLRVGNDLARVTARLVMGWTIVHASDRAFEWNNLRGHDYHQTAFVSGTGVVFRRSGPDAPSEQWHPDLSLEHDREVIKRVTQRWSVEQLATFWRMLAQVLYDHSPQRPEHQRMAAERDLALLAFYRLGDYARAACVVVEQEE